MPKIVVISRYIKPNSHKRFGNFIRYIATREGVEKPVPKQKADRELDREKFMHYLDSRPNSHGLFSDKDKSIVLDRVAKEVANHRGAIWTHIVSLKREDAERTGFIDLEHWQELVRRHILDIAEAQRIKPENIQWYAAFHNKETNPHVHIVVYSDDPHEGFLTKKGIDKIRSAFANDIYKDELQNLYQKQTAVRDKLRSKAENMMEALLSELKNNNLFDPILEQLILKLQVQLHNSKGKKVYGYLQPSVKDTVDRITAELAKNPVLKKMYAEWCSLEQQKHETYTSAVQKFPPLEENKVFKPIKNAIIRAVLDMWYSKHNIEQRIETLTRSAETGSPNDAYALGKIYLFGNGVDRDIEQARHWLTVAAEAGNNDAAVMLENMNRHNLTATHNAIVSMLLSFGRLISEDYDRSLRGEKLRTEHKLKAAIRRKKAALGLKESPLENQQFKGG